MEQFVQRFKEVSKIVKMSNFYRLENLRAQQPAKTLNKQPKQKKTKEPVELSRIELMQKLKDKINMLKDQRSTKKDPSNPNIIRKESKRIKKMENQKTKSK